MIEFSDRLNQSFRNRDKLRAKIVGPRNTNAGDKDIAHVRDQSQELVSGSTTNSVTSGAGMRVRRPVPKIPVTEVHREQRETLHASRGETDKKKGDFDDSDASHSVLPHSPGVVSSPSCQQKIPALSSANIAQIRLSLLPGNQFESSQPGWLCEARSRNGIWLINTTVQVVDVINSRAHSSSEYQFSIFSHSVFFDKVS